MEVPDGKTPIRHGDGTGAVPRRSGRRQLIALDTGATDAPSEQRLTDTETGERVPAVLGFRPTPFGPFTFLPDLFAAVAVVVLLYQSQR